jgi:antitoxin MazE
MRKNLTAIGSSLGLIIDKPIAELYQLDRDTIVEITPKEDGLNIRFLPPPPQTADNDEVLKAAKSINKRYGKMMRNLAK